MTQMEDRIVERLWETFRDEDLGFATPQQTANARNIWFSALAMVFAELAQTPESRVGDAFDAVREELLEFVKMQKPRKLH